jgi:pilus assembly protein Flp/PilA
MFSSLLSKLRVFAADRRGVTAMEYGLIAAFIAVAIIGGVTAVGTNLGQMMTDIAANFAGVGAAPAP